MSASSGQYGFAGRILPFSIAGFFLCHAIYQYPEIPLEGRHGTDRHIRKAGPASNGYLGARLIAL